jgi:hypothetical protein
MLLPGESGEDNDSSQLGLLFGVLAVVCNQAPPAFKSEALPLAPT